MSYCPPYAPFFGFAGVAAAVSPYFAKLPYSHVLITPFLNIVSYATLLRAPRLPLADTVYFNRWYSAVSMFVTLRITHFD